MTASNKRKNEFLGMPYGTAAHQLRKQIMFHLLQRLGEDLCFQCGQKIEELDELSMEHKKPWLGVSIELFWDIGNIAFSHLACNSGAGRRNQKSVGQLQWCTGCKELHPIADFREVNKVGGFTRSGRSQYCTKAESAMKADWRARTGKH